MERVRNTQKLFKGYEIDALLVTSPYNLRYVSNFTGTSGLALITADDAYFVTDFRYTEQATDQAKGFKVIEAKSFNDEIARILKQHQIESLGYETDHLTVSEFKVYEKDLDVNLVPVSGLIESLREIKEIGEVEKIKKAIQITESALEHIFDFIKPGITEIEVANELDFYMRKLGASGVSFDTIVASGVRSAMPHGVASHKVIELGDMITIDFGCYYEGYVSDMTRTFALGDPGEKLKEIYEIVRVANQKVHEQVRPGLTGKEMDAIARDYITECGYGEYFGHSTGHGIGLEIHEAPAISWKNDQGLKPGHTITNEPGIYLPGIGGVRIEDDIWVQKDRAENLMTFTHDLIIL